MRLLFILAIFSAVLYSCDEPYEFDSDQAPPQVVINGLITDRTNYQAVTITKSVDFYSKGENPKITNARVTVTDDLGETVNFIHNPNNHRDSMGIYIPQTDFVGKIGRTYTLRVEAEGEVYEAKDKLLSVLSADSISYQIDEDEEEDPEVEGRIYELLFFAHEPQDERNFYLFKFYRNDSLVYNNDTDIYYSDDELLTENIEGVESPVYYGANDKGTIEIYSLTRMAYVYYNDLATLLNGDGGMFGPVPSSPRNNLSNGALGIFQCSAVTSSSIVVK